VEVTYLSVCSGIEAATVAWHQLGFSPVAFAEIEKFPCAVLQHHYPDVPNWGDLTKFKDWPDADIDLLVGGTPCQSFSVAGLREGLADPRGNLALTYLAVADRYRPRWLLWENVPGVLSADEGRAFGSILGGLAELGYGFAYRVLDAQYFGLAQRRKRVFVVGHLGDWRRAAAVLFERESLSGHPAPCRTTGQDVTHPLASRTRSGSGYGPETECPVIAIPERARALTSSNQRIDYETETLIAHALKADGFDASEGGTGRGTPLIAETLRGHPRPGSNTVGAVVALFDERVVTSPDNRSSCRPDGAAPTVHQSPFAIAFSAQDHGNDAAWDISPTVRKGGDGGGVQPCIAFDARQSDVLNYGDKSGPLDTDGHTIAVQSRMHVRRLTPRECERLQGFPDDYTLIPYRGKPAADGPRYKALGNSMAVPCMRWIGERIALVDSLTRDLDVLVGDAEGVTTDLDAPSVSEGS
jgi:DNA (cytosine-5)-methyltransferase 1